jgi:REP element-mobilizing transposase RayT
MNFIPDNVYHVYNQGNNHQTIFSRPADYLLFLSLYKTLFEKIVDTLAWSLMPNHFHFMIHATDSSSIKIRQGGIIIDPVTNGYRKLLSGYARIFNQENKRSGSLFRQKTKAKRISDINATVDTKIEIPKYYINCFHYVHQNPLRANLITKLEDWEYSSFLDYANLRSDDLCNKELAVKLCGYDAENFVKTSYEMIEIVNSKDIFH